jgi:hypothetical protein
VFKKPWPLLGSRVVRDLKSVDREVRNRWALASVLFFVVWSDPNLAIPFAAAALAFRGGREG